jgi:hypothetical protein
VSTSRVSTSRVSTSPSVFPARALDRPEGSESYPGVLPHADADPSCERARWGRGAFAAPLAAVAWLSLLGLVASTSRIARADAPGLTIETGSPDALCPDLATARAAVERRLGQLVVPDGSAFTARYTIGHAPSGTPRDFVRLELFGPDGKVQLARDLPLDGESCSTMADVIALVLDRHFRALLGREPAPEPAVEAGPPAPAPAPAPPSASGMKAEVSPAIDADRGPADIGAGASRPRSADSISVELASHGMGHVALGARAIVGLGPQVLVGGALHLGLSEEREVVSAGEVNSRELVTRAFVAWAPRWGALDAYLGPGLRLALARGTGEGLATSDSGLRLRPCFGADAGLAWHPGERWVLSAFTAVDVMVPRMGGWFSVDGSEVLEPPPLRLWLGVGVGYSP